jgi:enoyl-CoA hydratase/carnithine racemase
MQPQRDAIPSDGPIQVTVRDRIAWIVLNRPEALNAISNGIRTELPAALERIERDDGVRVIIVRGAGSRAFCVGADIKEFGGAVSPVKARQNLVHHSYVEAFERATKPTIAAISGFCLGGGLELALACDIRMASADASFGLPEVNLGLIPGGGGTQRLPRMVGLGVALDLMLTGRRIDASEALRLGLVSRLASTQEALLQDVEQTAKTIADKPPMAAAFVKEAARKGNSLGIEAGLRLEKDLFSLLLSTKDQVEAALAFQQKRPPQFSGE